MSFFRALKTIGHSTGKGRSTRTVMRPSLGSNSKITRRTHNARRPRANNRPALRRLKKGRLF